MIKSSDERGIDIMNNSALLAKSGTHKLLVTGSNPVAATNFKSSLFGQGITSNPQAYSHRDNGQGMPLKQAIQNYLLSCKVEGKSEGTIVGYSKKFKAFLWYASNCNFPDGITC